MNNEIGRKITSLTLMTIMFAGALVAAVPSMVPAAHAANANLFVSTENSQFQNTFAGPMVTEVVINDPDIDDTDQGKGEPDVKVNGNKLRMVQNTDGKWYGYFADRAQAQLADQIAFNSAPAGNSTDFGVFCNKDSTVGGAAFTQTVGIAVARSTSQAINGTKDISTATCGSVSTSGPVKNHVVRENKTINGAFNNLGISTTATNGAWPIIQLYNFNPTGNVVVTYNKGGNPQTTTLKFDTVDAFSNLDLDRAKYPRSSEVALTLTDIQLNIDPTDEDSWTFGTNSTNSTLYYQLFDESGLRDGDGFYTSATNLINNRTNLMFEDNGILKINTAAQGGSPVIQIVDNADTRIVGTNGPTEKGTLAGKDQPVTFVEIGTNTGIFSNYDENDKANIEIKSDAARGKSATVDYNKKAKSIVVGFGFATIDIQSPQGEWNSGEETPVTLVDEDANKNTRADEDLDVNNPKVDLIPSLQTGNPFTLGKSGTGSSTKIDALFMNHTSFSLPNGIVSGPIAHPGNNGFKNFTGNATVQAFSNRALITPNNTAVDDIGSLVIDLKQKALDLFASINDPRTNAAGKHVFRGFNLLNIDVRGINSTLSSTNVYLLNSTGKILVDRVNGKTSLGSGITAISLVNGTDVQSLTNLNSTAAGDINSRVTAAIFTIPATQNIGLLFNFTTVKNDNSVKPIVADFFSFGFKNDGVKSSERVANQIIRLELEETGDNTSTFVGTLEYRMVNQLNILDASLYNNLSTIEDEPQFIVIEDLTDEDSPRVNYLDLGADGVSTQIADQQAAPSHSGVVSFDKSSYKIADTVLITLEDQDLNTDTDTIDIYTTVDPLASGKDTASDAVGKAGLPVLNFGALGRLLDVTFDDLRWTNATGTATDGSQITSACSAALDDVTTDVGLFATGFTLIETGPATGVFTGDFQIPPQWCRPDGTTTTPETTTGKDIEVNYVDFRDASGEIIEVGDGAGVRANTGSVSLDRTVYPVPWGIPDDFATNVAETPKSNTQPARSVFPVHQTGTAVDTDKTLDAGEFLADGDLTIHVRVNDPDFDISAAGEDKIAQDVAAKPGFGPVKISVIRGAQTVVLGYAGGTASNDGVIDVGDNNATAANVRQFGPITEIAPAAGIFEADIDLRYTDGPASTTCPSTGTYLSANGNGTRLADPKIRFDAAPSSGTFCILQGDILQVEYTDPEDASGDVNTVTDSATFDLRNGVLQSDKSVYIIGSDMILTLIEPDFDLDNDQAETYDLDLIEWDSDAATVTMGDLGGATNAAAFDPEPTDFRETGDSTGIFQIVIEIPKELSGDKLERGEEIVLEYTDWGPSGADYVGEEDQDVNLTIFTSNFGATVELDQKVYTWTDKVYITIVAPDHNFDSNLIDEIGTSSDDPVKVATRGKKLDNYKLVETGTDTGIFTGEVILTGFCHDADGNTQTGVQTAGGTCSVGDDTNPRTTGSGPTSGFLQSTDNDGLTVSFEFSEDETVVGSALIRWNIGEVQWLEASYPAKGTGVVRVVDPDMNLNPEAVDNFNVDVWSDSDAGGIDLTVTETNEATGIFEGTVFFTTTDESSGHRLRVSEGDTITAEYEDNTLPSPYTRADELDIQGTAIIGTIVPPLERAPASNARVVDAFGNALASVSVDQQVQITADLANGQDRAQAFAYLVQVQDGNGVTVSLAWITGSLSPGQSFSPALSWIPSAAGSYKATIFVWESVDNPTALSPPVSVNITVQ